MGRAWCSQDGSVLAVEAQLPGLPGAAGTHRPETLLTAWVPEPARLQPALLTLQPPPTSAAPPARLTFTHKVCGKFALSGWSCYKPLQGTAVIKRGRNYSEECNKE